MKNLFKLILLVCAGTFFAACNNDNLETIDPTDPTEGGVYTGPMAVRSLGFTIPDLDNVGIVTKAEEDADEAISFGLQPATRATVAAEAAEKTIKSVYIVQFDNASNKAVAVVSVPASDIKGSVTTGYTADAALAEVASTIYVFANTSTFKTTPTVGMTKSAFEANEVKFNAAIDIANGLPMMGTGTLAAGAESATVNMSFLCARVRTTVTNSLTGLTNVKVSMGNVAKWVPITAPTTTATTGKTGSDFMSYAAVTPSTNLTFYIPEFKAGTKAGLTAKTKSWWDAPDHAVYLRITGTYASKNVKYDLYLGANSTTDFNVVRNTAYTINPTIKGANATSDLRIASGDADVNLNSDGKFANCYMVADAGRTYYFNATVKGNKANIPTSSQGATAIAPTKAAQLWSTGDATYVIRKWKFDADNKRIVFSTSGTIGTPREGNVLLAAQDASSKNLWSWHIWSTAYTGATEDYTLRAGSGTNAAPSGTIKMMTRNLGAAGNTPGDATSFGLLYQWGRKDPFVGAAATSGTTYATSTMGQNWPVTASTTSTGTVAYAIANPTTFITQCNTTTYDWIYAAAVANQINDLWGNPSSITGSISITNLNKNNPAKSVYDPCPKGFKVPPQYAWTRFTTTGNNSSTASEFNVNGSFNYGWTFYRNADKSGATTFYPATGLRNSGTGVLGNVGTSGSNWASSPLLSGNHGGGLLWFHSTLVDPLAGSNRAYAFPVRCVQE